MKERFELLFSGDARAQQWRNLKQRREKQSRRQVCRDSSLWAIDLCTILRGSQGAHTYTLETIVRMIYTPLSFKEREKKKIKD